MRIVPKTNRDILTGLNLVEPMFSPHAIRLHFVHRFATRKIDRPAVSSNARNWSASVTARTTRDFPISHFRTMRAREQSAYCGHASCARTQQHGQSNARRTVSRYLSLRKTRGCRSGVVAAVGPASDAPIVSRTPDYTIIVRFRDVSALTKRR